jgi:hypothetical protein
LLQAGLAGLRYRLFAKQRFGRKDRGSAHRYCPSLGDIPAKSSWEIIMPNLAHQNDVQIDRVHSDAICEEIGERLSVALGPQRHELPPRLIELMDNLRRSP